MMSEKCIVHNCPNHKHEGSFIGDLCAPCHTMITSGEIKYGKTFVHEIRDRIEELEATLAKAVEIAEVLSGAVEYDYHGNVADPEERQAIQELAELKGHTVWE